MALESAVHVMDGASVSVSSLGGARMPSVPALMCWADNIFQVFQVLARSYLPSPRFLLFCHYQTALTACFVIQRTVEISLGTEKKCIWWTYSRVAVFPLLPITALF